MANIGDVMLAVVADMRGFTTTVVKGAEKAGDQAAKGLSGRFQKGLKSDIGRGFVQGLGIGGALGVTNALESGTRALVGAIFDSIQAASDQREAMSLTGQVFEENTGQMEEWAEGAADAFGQSKTEALNFASSFGTAFKNVGFGLDETAEKSKDLTRLAADLGSAFNASSDEAALALRSGLLGESEPLRRFGVFLSEAAVTAELMRTGQKKVNGEWTNGQKVLARYNIIMKQTADSQGMFGRDTESLADAQKRLSAEVENLSAEAGEMLIPIITDLVQGLNEGAIPAIRETIDEIKAGEGPIVRTAQAFDNLTKMLDVFAGVEKDAAEQSDILGSKTTFLGQALHDIFDPGWRTRVEDASAALIRARDVMNDDVVPAAQGAAGALDRVGDETGEIASNAVDAKQGIGDLASTLRDAAETIITDYYDPIQAKEELAAAFREQESARRILRSRSSTDAEVQDARRRITASEKEIDTISLDLLQKGQLSDAAKRKWINNLDARAKSGTAATKRYVDNLRAAIERLDKVRAVVDIIARITTAGITYTGANPYPQRQSGGDVEARQPVIVGEQRRELFVPDVPGHVYPTVGAGLAAMSEGGGGGDTIIDLDVHGLPMRAETPSEVAASLRRVASLGILRPRRTTRFD